jgi:hypothetical protein
VAKAKVTVPSRVYAPSGALDSGNERIVSLPNLTTDDNGVKITFTRESWPDGPPAGAEILSGVIEGSDDGGQTFYGLCVFGYAGGDMTNPKTGLPVTVCGPTVGWPEKNDGNGNMIPQRPAQVQARIANSVTLRTGITLEGV